MSEITDYAIFRSGGRQFRASVGDTLRVDKLPQEAGSAVEFDQVLFLTKNGEAKVGSPLVTGAKVKAKVVDHGRDKKVIVFKYKPKVRYRRKTGHRQDYTELSIEGITAGRARRARAAKPKTDDESEAE